MVPNFEELLEKSVSNKHIADLLNNLDILVDGRFILAERSLELKFRGSKNQRIINVPESIKTRKAIEIEI